MNHLTTLSKVARAAALIVLVVAESIVLERSELARFVLESVQIVVAKTAGFALGFAGLENTIRGIRIDLVHGAVEVTEDCVGLDISLFLASAMLVHPAPLRSKLLGFAASLLVVTGLNWVRVVTLAYLVVNSRAIFDVAHYYVWPGAILAACIGTFLLWIGSLPSSGEAPREAHRP